MEVVPSTEDFHGRRGSSRSNFNGKSESRRTPVAFGKPSNGAEEEEKRRQKADGGKNGGNVKGKEEKEWKRERPASAGFSWSEREGRKGTRSWEATGGEATSEKARRRGAEEPRCPRWRHGCPCAPSPEPESRCSSGWGFCASEGEPRACFRFPSRSRRKCKSGSDFSRGTSRMREKISDGERDFRKAKRSLGLLGFEPEDFGIPSRGAEAAPRRRPKRASPTFSTKVTGRSVSLDSLRAAVRRAWLGDGPDESHRRLLAQAAYEEWYFRKERELREKREEDRMTRAETKLKLRDDFQRKKEKSEEEFQKWLTRKEGRRRKGQDATAPEKQLKEKPFVGLMDTKEKSEKAFLDWKKAKEREINRKKMERRKEEEDKVASERQKAERKILAEKAFQQWKAKLEESEKRKDGEMQMIKRKQEAEERRKRAEGSQISFQIWKEAKDEEKKRMMKQCREADKTAREERFAQMEERMYEAEQAFEDWLEKVDLRRQKQFYSVNICQKSTPWIPA